MGTGRGSSLVRFEIRPASGRRVGHYERQDPGRNTLEWLKVGSCFHRFADLWLDTSRTVRVSHYSSRVDPSVGQYSVIDQIKTRTGGT